MIEHIPGLIKSATPKLALAIFLGTTFLFFAPLELIAKIGLVGLRETHATGLGISLVASGALTSVNLLHTLLAPAQLLLRRRRTERDTEKTLEVLTFQERAALFPFLRMSRATVYFPLENGISNGLVAQGILYRASNISRIEYLGYFAYNLQPVARKILLRHPQYFDEVENYLGDDHTRLREIVPIMLS